MVSIYTNHRGRFGAEPNLSRCRASVPEGGRSVEFRQCSMKPKVTRNGIGYCTMHDPERVTRVRKEKDKQFEAEWKRKKIRYELEDAERKLLDYIIGTSSLTIDYSKMHRLAQRVRTLKVKLNG